MERITSLQNTRIRAWTKLGERKERLANGCFLVEGIRLVTEALVSGAPVLQLLADESGMPHLRGFLEKFPEVEPIAVTSEVLAKLSDTRTPQGVAALVQLPRAAYGGTDAQSVLHASGETDIGERRILCLERVQDPGNVGTMIRTADACGFDTVVLSSDSADPWQPKAVRSTMGSVWHLEILLSDDLEQTVRAATHMGLRTIAAHPREAEPVWRVDLKAGFMLVIGNEANGLSEAMRRAVSLTVMIPMEGRAESLNAAAAASMLLYESLRQRRM